MFVVNDDLSIYVTRGDIVCLNVSAVDDKTGGAYEFQPGDIVRMKIFGKKDAENVVMQKDFPVVAKTDTVGVLLTEKDTKFGEVISKPRDYWYEIELNPFTNPQTIIGYDEDGAKIFKLFPEGKDLQDEEEIEPEDIPIVDVDLDLTSSKPVENRAIARAVTLLKNDLAAVDARLTGKIKQNQKGNKELTEQMAVDRARVDNLIAHADVKLSQNLDYLEAITEETKAKIDGNINADGVFATITVNLREANLIYGGTSEDMFIIPVECRPWETGLIHTEDGLEYRINYDTANSRYYMSIKAQDSVTVAPSGAGSVTMSYALYDYEMKDLRVSADGTVHTSAGDAVREIDSRLDAMKERKYGYFQKVDIDAVENVVYNMVSKATLEIDGGWYCECDVSGCTIVLVNCSAWSQFNLFAGGAFYDSEGNLIKCFKNTEEGNFTDVEVFVPNGAVKMVVNGKRGYDIKVSVFVPVSLLDEISAIKNTPVTTNHWHGKKVVWLGTSVPFGANATKSYAHELSKKLNFELVNCSMPGLATHMNEDGTMLPYGSLCMSKEEYAEQGMNIPEAPLPYVPGGSCNNYYRTYENIFTEENADADLYVFDVVPNNTNFSTEDWDAFNAWNWRYKDGSDFADHRSTFLGAVLFLMDKMYSLNPNARMVFLLGSEFVYEKGKTAFALMKDKWNIPVIDVWGKANTSPKSLLVLRSENGTDSHPSTYAHEIMGNMLVGEFLGIS